MAFSQPGKKNELGILPEAHHDLLPRPKRDSKSLVKNSGDRHPSRAQRGDEHRSESTRSIRKRIVLNHEPVEVARFSQMVKYPSNRFGLSGIKAGDYLYFGWARADWREAGKNSHFMSAVREGL